MAEWQLLVALTLWIAHLSQPLHARLAWRRLAGRKAGGARVG